MRFRYLAAPAAILAVAAASACTPPPAPKPVRPPCGAEITRIWETAPVPCTPVPPQRLDVVPAMSNVLDPIEQNAATIRCNAWGGAIIWQTVAGINRFVCRTVDPDLYENATFNRVQP